MHTTNTMWTTRMRALALGFALLACCAGSLEAQDVRQEERSVLAGPDLATAQQVALPTASAGNAAARPLIGAKRYRAWGGLYPTDDEGGTTSNTEDPPLPPDDGGDPPTPPPGGGYDLDGDKGSDEGGTTSNTEDPPLPPDDGGDPPTPPPGGGYDLDGGKGSDEGGTTSNTEDPPLPPDDGGDPPTPPPGGGYDRIEMGDDGYVRSGLALEQPDQPALGNYPNPFNPETTIRFALPEGQAVRLIVYNALGQTVQVLADGWYETGAHEARFAADQLPSGTYFVRLQTNAGLVTHSMVLAR